MLLAGRLLYGLGIGFAMHGAPAYIAETVPQSIRGLALTCKEMLIVIGILLGYVVSYELVSSVEGWRYIYFASAFPAAILGGVMVRHLPLAFAPCLSVPLLHACIMQLLTRCCHSWRCHGATLAPCLSASLSHACLMLFLRVSVQAVEARSAVEVTALAISIRPGCPCIIKFEHGVNTTHQF